MPYMRFHRPSRMLYFVKTMKRETRSADVYDRYFDGTPLGQRKVLNANRAKRKFPQRVFFVIRINSA